MATEQQLTALRNAVVNYIERVNNRVVPLDFHIVDNDEDLNTLLGMEQSFDEVFSKWKRISHNNTALQPALQGELDVWSYDSVNDRIVCTFNSTSLIGFISPTKHDDYVFEVVVKSTNVDDDSIGICFGYVVDEFGVEHTLTALRTTGGSQNHAPSNNGGVTKAKLFDVYYDRTYNHRVDLGSTNGGLKWGDGIVDDNRNPPSDIGAGGWGAHPNGCRIKVTRVGDIITLETTDLNTATYVPTATVTVDLNSHPELAKFKGPCQFGYVCYSQPNSTWDVISRPGSREPIFDIRNNTLYQWTGTEWQTTVIGAYPVINVLPQDKSFYFSPINKRLFYYDSRIGLMTANLKKFFTHVASRPSYNWKTEDGASASSCVYDGIIYHFARDAVNQNIFLSYDPGTDTWSELAPPPVQIFFTTGSAYGGKIYTKWSNRLYIYDIANNSWSLSSLAPSNFGSPHNRLCDVIDGNVYVNYFNDDDGKNYLYRYDPAANNWTSLVLDYGPLNTGIAAASAAASRLASHNGLIYSLTLISESPDVFELRSMDPLTGTVTTLASPSAIVRRNAAVNSYMGKLIPLNGRLYVTGLNTNVATQHVMDYYDIGTNTWSTLTSDGEPFSSGSHVGLDGKIYSIGNYTSIGNNPLFSPDIVKYFIPPA